jgi:DNA replication protein DnaC
MEKEMLYELQIYYGELMQKLKNCNDYFREKRIKKKMKSIECLLDIDYLT